MNNPSPFNPESSAPEQKNQTRTRVRTAVTLVFAANFIALMALLIIGFGCRKPAEPEAAPASDTNAMTMPAFDTNSVPQAGTNAPATNAMVYVPPALEPPVSVASAGQEYVIVKGDTFAVLAKNFHVSVKAIQDANPGVDPKKLKIRQKIQIPAAAAMVPAAGATAVADMSGAEQTYKVKSGDTLTGIAKHLNVSVKAIEKANPQIDPNKLKVGDKLKVPAKASAPVAAPVVPEATAPAPASAPAATSPKPL